MQMEKREARSFKIAGSHWRERGTIMPSSKFPKSLLSLPSSRRMCVYTLYQFVCSACERGATLHTSTYTDSRSLVAGNDYNQSLSFLRISGYVRITKIIQALSCDTRVAELSSAQGRAFPKGPRIEGEREAAVTLAGGLRPLSEEGERGHSRGGRNRPAAAAAVLGESACLPACPVHNWFSRGPFASKFQTKYRAGCWPVGLPLLPPCCSRTPLS